jgi:iron complex transport system substrate-binding protein
MGNALRLYTEIETVRGRIAGQGSRPRVYCEEWGKPMLRSQPWVSELVSIAGGDFLGTPATQAAAEDVIVADPEVIVIAWCGPGDRVPLEKLVKERAWTGSQAVRERRVYCIRDELLTTPAPILVRGLQALAAAIPPEIFAAPEGLRRIAGVE